jgi:hypothetical protein
VWAILKSSKANLRPLKVDQNCDRDASFSCRLTNAIKTILVFVISTMREVEAGHIHSRCDEFANFLRGFNSRT